MLPEERKLYVQILGQMLIADGVLADNERTYLDSLMDRIGLPATDRRAALSGISLDSPIEERIAALSPAAKNLLRAEIDSAARADGALARAEEMLLTRVRTAIG